MHTFPSTFHSTHLVLRSTLVVHIQHVRSVLRRRAAVMAAALSKVFPPSSIVCGCQLTSQKGEDLLSFVRPLGGYFVWVHLRHGVVAEQLLERCKADAVQPVDFFCGPLFSVSGKVGSVLLSGALI